MKRTSGWRGCLPSKRSAGRARSSRAPWCSRRFKTRRAPTAPALVAQSFGKGHVAALLIGDLWRWGMRRENQAEDDFDRSWRQTVRWLVGDVPSRVEVTVRPKRDSETPALHLGSSSARRRISSARQCQGHLSRQSSRG